MNRKKAYLLCIMKYHVAHYDALIRYKTSSIVIQQHVNNYDSIVETHNPSTHFHEPSIWLS